MSDEGHDPSTPTTPSPLFGAGVGTPLLLRLHRKPFEHGLFPIPKLIFSDGTQTLGPLWDKLIGLSSTRPGRVDTPTLTKALQIPPGHARLILDTLASVFPFDPPDPAGTADVYDLVLPLYPKIFKQKSREIRSEIETIGTVRLTGPATL